MAIDKQKLVAHLKRKQEHPNLLIHAVMAGLITAVQRGDFDEEEER
jgi:hypothetical protein